MASVCAINSCQTASGQKMALFLSPQQLVKQATHSNTQLALQPYSTTPRQFTATLHDMPQADHETLSMNQTDPPVLSSNFEHITHDEDPHKSISPSHVVPDPPSWTPLRTLGGDGGLSGPDPQVDHEPSISRTLISTETAMKRLGELPATAQGTVKNGMIAGPPTLKSSSESSSGAKPSKGKRARFDGVFITTKPSLHYYDRLRYRSQKQSKPVSGSSAHVLTLVDALARTFDANKHTEGLSPHRSRAASHQPDSASSPPQTDVETTEAEDGQFRLNARLLRAPLNRRHTQARAANASETNSEDILPPERPVKRLKPIQYEANSELIDAALGTVHAPISWDAEMDLIVRGEDYVIPVQSVHVPSEDVRMAVDEGERDRTVGSSGEGRVLSSTPVGNKRHMPTWGNPTRSVLMPYLSRGTKFRQRLDAMFGENAAVRTDKIARPRPADHDFLAPFDRFDRELSPDVSDSTASAASASAVEEGASAIPSTHITSQSPDIPPTDTSMELSPGNELNETDSLTKPIFDAGDEEQVSGWVTALQRLVKGKVHVKEEDLDTLSVILAEIESVKDSLDESLSMISELHESVKQLSELYEIPFGDRNRLRQRAEDIVRTWLSAGKSGSS